ncbi:hypothetical protein BCR34DRAFT_3086 [Clohesyomyces aquaticus]|uniref:Uncharacterized protein n=1 Tax=Clohesyomyces aquaticus TaxID=1231657 RepID=A0A1Y2AB90_9PLEO|nr:hypothetical protein BCR34DRAFT_3086 [Clohesyomyces aquaticus]
MARRFTNRDFVQGEERPTSGPVSLARLVPVHPIRRQGSKWRPLQLSDFPEGDNEDGDQEAHDELGGFDAKSGQQLNLEPSERPQPMPRASPSDLPQLQTNVRQPTNDSRGTGDGSVVSTIVNSEDVSPTDTRRGPNEKTRVFGETPLPDPIHLRTQIGNFDGHVVFIGHPNRDISAHQWSSHAFQWHEIGRYSLNRRNIEGSLAQDRLEGGNVQQESLQGFKVLAGQREKRAVTRCRQKEIKLPDPASILRVETLSRPTFTDGDRFASLSSASGSNTDQFPTLSRLSQARAGMPANKAPTSAPRTIKRDYLEDPFVTPVKPAVPTNLNLNPINRTVDEIRGGGLRLTGSMDFKFEFPPPPTSPQETRTSQAAFDPEVRRQIFQEREKERIRRELRPQERQMELELRDVDIGEDAMSGINSSARRLTISRPQVPMSPEDIHTRQKLKSKLVELGDQSMRTNIPPDGRIAVPDVPGFPGQQAPTYKLFPPPGLTVANPNRIVSNLNAAAAPYNYFVNQDSGSEATTTLAPTADTLMFSDPDGMRQVQNREIAGGLGHQGPTPQNFKGPFFADTIPTSHNPTLPLASHVDEQEKLRMWFRDGNRPERQEEFYKSVMATANLNAEARSMNSLGTIGDNSPRGPDPHNFGNSRAFMRLYETIREYADQSLTNQAERDYFTRAWKAAPPSRDLGNHGSPTHFEGLYPINNRGRQSYGVPSWGGFGISPAAPNRGFGGANRR